MSVEDEERSFADAEAVNAAKLLRDRWLHGIEFVDVTGKRIDPARVEAAKEPVEVRFDPETFHSEKQRIKQAMRDDPLNF